VWSYNKAPPTSTNSRVLIKSRKAVHLVITDAGVVQTTVIETAAVGIAAERAERTD